MVPTLSAVQVNREGNLHGGMAFAGGQQRYQKQLFFSFSFFPNVVANCDQRAPAGRDWP